MKMMYDVFLSYSSVDLTVAREVLRRLKEKNLNVFFDQEAIHAEEFPMRIARGIQESKVFLFLASVNSVSSIYARGELTYAIRFRKPMVIYKIDNCTFPDDIQLLFAALNQRDIAKDSIDVVLDDILLHLAGGEITNFARVAKRAYEDDSLRMLLEMFYKLDFYSVINYELQNDLWKDNWNHHLLLMSAYKAVGDRRNYGILLQEYQGSGIKYYPQFYDVISQVWDMLKFGYIREAATHAEGLLQAQNNRMNEICSSVNHAHMLLLSGNRQEALNNYINISQSLNPQERYLYLQRDFDTLNWLGYNQLSSNVITEICSRIGYQQRYLLTNIQGNLNCQDYESVLCSHSWHWRENRVHIILSYRKYNGIGNAMYYFVEYEQNLPGRMFGVLPFGLDEKETIQNSEREFTQYRLTMKNNRLFVEEYHPIKEFISCGEVVRLNDRELHIKIIDNGNPQSAGTIRRYNAID